MVACGWVGSSSSPDCWHRRHPDPLGRRGELEQRGVAGALPVRAVLAGTKRIRGLAGARDNGVPVGPPRRYDHGSGRINTI
jgi:hypothetical protein